MDEALRATERATRASPEDPDALRGLARDLARAGDEVGAWKARARLAVTDGEAWAELAGRRAIGVRAIGEVVRRTWTPRLGRRVVGATGDQLVLDGQEVLGPDLQPRWTASRTSTVLAGPRVFGVESEPLVPGMEARDLVVARTRDGAVLQRGLLASFGEGSYFGGGHTARWLVFYTRGALLVVDATLDDPRLLVRHPVDQRVQTLTLSGRYLLRPTDPRRCEVRDLEDGALTRTIAGRVCEAEGPAGLIYPEGRGGPRLALVELETGEERLSVRGPREGLLARERIVARWNEELVGIERTTGRRCWRRPCDEDVELAASADVLYMARRTQGQVEALDLPSGEPLWTHDLSGSAGRVRLLPADGALFVQTSEDGQVALTRIAAPIA